MSILLHDVFVLTTCGIYSSDCADFTPLLLFSLSLQYCINPVGRRAAFPAKRAVVGCRREELGKTRGHRREHADSGDDGSFRHAVLLSI